MTPVERFDEYGLGAGAEQSRRNQQPDRLSRAPLRPPSRPDHHRSAQLQRCEDPDNRPDVGQLWQRRFPVLLPARKRTRSSTRGRAYNDGNPPDEIVYGETRIANYRKTGAPHTILGATQKAWFLDRLRSSRATWKIWGNSLGALDWRGDPQNVPAGLTPSAGAAPAIPISRGGDYRRRL